MTQKIKWMTMAEAWALVQKLLKKMESIQEIAGEIGCHWSTIYRWEEGGSKLPDARHTIALKELAIRKGVIKA